MPERLAFWTYVVGQVHMLAWMAVCLHRLFLDSGRPGWMRPFPAREIIGYLGVAVPLGIGVTVLSLAAGVVLRMALGAASTAWGAQVAAMAVMLVPVTILLRFAPMLSEQARARGIAGGFAALGRAWSVLPGVAVALILWDMAAGLAPALVLALHGGLVLPLVWTLAFLTARILGWTVSLIGAVSVASALYAIYVRDSST